MEDNLVDFSSEQVRDIRVTAIADTFSALVDHAREGGTFRHLIYERLKVDAKAYSKLYLAGGMTITNNFILSENDDSAPPSAFVNLKELAQNAPMEAHPTMTKSDGTPMEYPSELRASLFEALHLIEDLMSANRMLLASNARLACQLDQACQDQADTHN